MNSDDVDLLFEVVFMGNFCNLLDNEVFYLSWEILKIILNNYSLVIVVRIF